ncbi:hypothetical protein [Pseudidiomarina sp.]|uniref:hypothetical protein n=1 Tax=Pseudidiomarina sp. TaxID=2081707 RepID=UPI003A981C4C
MTERYSYIKSFSELSEGHHKGIYQFSLSEADKKSCGLRICVNNKSSCDQILKRIFDEQVVNKLSTNKPFSQSGIKVSLESPITLKKEYFNSEKWVYLLLFPSPDLLSVVEKSSSNEVVVVFSETDYSDHLVQWAKDNDVKSLSTE